MNAKDTLIYQAGYSQSISDNDDWAKDTYGYKLGRKEVVDWVNSRMRPGDQDMWKDEWKAQLKKWGL